MGEAKREDDVVLLCGPTEDGGGVQVLRARENRVETGEVRPMKDGQPITGEVVRLSQRTEEPRVCDVEVLHQSAARTASKKDEPSQGQARRGTRGGPAQVATKAYRDQWSRVFGDDEAPSSSKNMN
jgi:hypothetical protein